jgi:hypothetical protein
VRRVAAVLLALFALAGPAVAAEWGGITPGTSTTETVRARYGAPSKTQTQKVEGYDTTTWIYENAQAPTGMTRMTVDFGLLQARGFAPNVVRSFRLDPHRGVFTRKAVLDGWGRPSGVSNEGGADSFFYEEGLLVIFDKEAEWSAESMVFTLPQPAGRVKPSP